MVSWRRSRDCSSPVVIQDSLLKSVGSMISEGKLDINTPSRAEMKSAFGLG